MARGNAESRNKRKSKFRENKKHPYHQGGGKRSMILSTEGKNNKWLDYNYFHLAIQLPSIQTPRLFSLSLPSIPRLPTPYDDDFEYGRIWILYYFLRWDLWKYFYHLFFFFVLIIGFILPGFTNRQHKAGFIGCHNRNCPKAQAFGFFMRKNIW